MEDKRELLFRFLPPRLSSFLEVYIPESHMLNFALVKKLAIIVPSVGATLCPEKKRGARKAYTRRFHLLR